MSLTKLFGAGDSMTGDIERLGIEFTASTGSKWVHYEGTSDAPVPIPLTAPVEAWIDLTPVLTGKDKDGKPFTFFYPFTTTFVDIQINRVPGPDLYTF